MSEGIIRLRDYNFCTIMRFYLRKIMIEKTNNNDGQLACNSGACIKAFPGSHKVYRSGKGPLDIRVPFREVSLNTKGADGENSSVLLYDTSGSYTDPDVNIDISKGLRKLKSSWIVDRGDVENDALNNVLCAKWGKNVTQMHYARVLTGYIL